MIALSSQIKTNTSNLTSILNKISHMSITGGTDTSDGTAENTDIVYGKVAYVKGERLEGTITNAEDGFSDADRYLIQQETLNGIASQSMSLAGKTNQVSTTEIISDLESVNNEVTKQTGLLSQIKTALQDKQSGGSPSVAEPVLQSKTITPSASQQEVIPDEGYDGLDKVIIEGDSELVAKNIKKGVNIFGVDGSFADVSTISLDNSNVTINGGDNCGITINFTQAVSSVLGYTIFFEHESERQYAMGGKINKKTRPCYWMNFDWDNTDNTSYYDAGTEEMSEDSMSLTLDDGTCVTAYFTNNTCTITGLCLVKYA